MLDRRSTALGLFVAFVALNLVLNQTDPGHRFFFLRGLPVWALAVRLVFTVPLPRSAWVLAALLLGSIGDIVLAARVPSHATVLFLSGMGIFLIGHLCFIAAFVNDVRLAEARRWPAVSILVFALAVSAVLVRVQGAKAIPLLIYAGALSSMAITASLRASSRWTVLAGAVFFVVSDAMIGVNQFVTPIPAAEFLILVTYWAAQFLIAEGWAADQKLAPVGLDVQTSHHGADGTAGI